MTFKKTSSLRGPISRAKCRCAIALLSALGLAVGCSGSETDDGDGSGGSGGEASGGSAGAKGSGGTGAGGTGSGGTRPGGSGGSSGGSASGGTGPLGGAPGLGGLGGGAALCEKPPSPTSHCADSGSAGEVCFAPEALLDPCHPTHLLSVHGATGDDIPGLQGDGGTKLCPSVEELFWGDAGDPHGCFDLPACSSPTIERAGKCCYQATSLCRAI